MFIGLTPIHEDGSKGKLMYWSVNEILCFFKENTSTRVQFKNQSGIDVVESPKQILQFLADQRK